MYIWRPLEGRYDGGSGPDAARAPDSARAEVDDIVIQGVAVRRAARRIMDGTMDARR